MSDLFGQMDIFDFNAKPRFKIGDKPIRLIELFAGIGSQAMALRDLGANFEKYRVVEIDKYAVDSYNAIHGTDFKPTDITKIGGADLGISETDKYVYIMFYSFPCTDLSLAGKQEGMEKGSGTRSGLLWEVERLLKECKELGELPQILILENVPQVHGLNNIGAFNDWNNFLISLGYTNWWKDLNAKEIGYPEPVAQNRERCFMVSLLGDYGYTFPQPLKLKKTMADYLEDEVDEKYYLKGEKVEKLISELISSGELETLKKKS